MIDNVSSVQYTGVFDSYIPRILENEKDAKGRVIKKLEEESKKVGPIYNSTGKLIEYDEHGRHLDTKA
jgi:hypothetical protein